MSTNRLPMIGVRVTPEFRELIAEEAERQFGGNESLLMRKATSLYIDLHKKLGVQFQPTIDSLLGDADDEAA